MKLCNTQPIHQCNLKCTYWFSLLEERYVVFSAFVSFLYRLYMVGSCSKQNSDFFKYNILMFILVCLQAETCVYFLPEKDHYYSGSLVLQILGKDRLHVHA